MYCHNSHKEISYFMVAFLYRAALNIAVPHYKGLFYYKSLGKSCGTLIMNAINQLVITRKVKLNGSIFGCYKDL